MQAKALWIKAWASGSKSRLSKACNLQDRKQVFCPFHPLENIMDMLPQENKYHGFACDLKASRMHQLLTHCFHSFQMSFLNMAVNNLRMLSVATSRPGPWGFWPEAWWFYDSFRVPVTLLRSVLYPCRSLPADRLATLASVKVQPRGVGKVRVAWWRWHTTKKLT